MVTIKHAKTMKTTDFRQSELVDLFAENKTILFAFRSLYQVRHSKPAGYYVQKLPQKLAENWTARGRFIAYTPEEADSILAKHYNLAIA